jgi:catechol 2,3-dioxygenase-like lactoylglutathione lyase family enzyme
MRANTLHHVSINVTDLERARRFYAEVLGLEEIPRPPFDFPGAWYRLGDRQLHLIVHPATHTLRGTTAISSREGHFAIGVESFEAARTRLEASGIPFDARPRGRTPWAQIFLADPDGNLIELSAGQPPSS